MSGFQRFWITSGSQTVSGFQTLSINRTILSGFRTSGPFTLQRPDFECPVPIVRIDQNRFGTGSKPVWNRFGTGFGGFNCPIVRNPEINVRISASGYRTLRLYHMSEIRTIRNPDAFSSGLPNRTSDNRTFTVDWKWLKMINFLKFFTTLHVFFTVKYSHINNHLTSLDHLLQ